MPNPLGSYIEDWLWDNRSRAAWLADNSNLSRGYVSDIIRGNRTPSTEATGRMAAQMGVSHDYLEFLCGRWPQDIVEGEKLSAEEFALKMEGLRK